MYTVVGTHAYRLSATYTQYTLIVSHFKLPRILEISLNKGKPLLCLVNLLLKYLKPVTHLLPMVTFVLIKVTAEEYGEIIFTIPKMN